MIHYRRGLENSLLTPELGRTTLRPDCELDQRTGDQGRKTYREHRMVRPRLEG